MSCSYSDFRECREMGITKCTFIEYLIWKGYIAISNRWKIERLKKLNNYRLFTMEKDVHRSIRGQAVTVFYKSRVFEQSILMAYVSEFLAALLEAGCNGHFFIDFSYKRGRNERCGFKVDFKYLRDLFKSLTDAELKQLCEAYKEMSGSQLRIDAKKKAYYCKACENFIGGFINASGDRFKDCSYFTYPISVVYLEDE